MGGLGCGVPLPRAGGTGRAAVGLRSPSLSLAGADMLGAGYEQEGIFHGRPCLGIFSAQARGEWRSGHYRTCTSDIASDGSDKGSLDIADGTA